MNRYLGEIRPIGSRWVWPFRDMQEGDWFLVSWELRDPESVRNMASVRGSQLGKRFMVEKRPPEHLGFTKVTCGSTQPLRRMEDVNFETIGRVLRRCYEVEHGDLLWTMLEEGQVQEVEAEQIEEPLQPVYMVSIPDKWRFVVELLPDRVRIRRVATRETLAGWYRRQLAAMLD